VCMRETGWMDLCIFCVLAIKALQENFDFERARAIIVIVIIVIMSSFD
jgi:hypothetical protein